MNRRCIAHLLAAAALGALPVMTPRVPWAQVHAVDITPQQKLMSLRAAQLDAYRLLAERIYGLELASHSTVRDYLTEDDRIAGYFEKFLKGARFGPPRYYDDGSCEIDAEVTLEQLVNVLKRSYDDVYQGGKWRREQFDELTRRTERKVIQVTGSGAASIRSQLPDPAQEPILPKVAPLRDQEIKLPPIYRRYPPAERLKAKRAAELDAYRLMLERIYGLELDSTTTVGNYVTKYDAIRTATEGFLRGVRPVSTRYNADGVVEVTMQITLEQAVTVIRRALDQVDRDGFPQVRRQLDDVTRRTERKVLTVVGSGALDVSDEDPHDPAEPTEVQPTGEPSIVVN